MLNNKSLVFYIVATILAIACNSESDQKRSMAVSAEEQAKDTANYTTIEWIDTLVDIGRMAPASKRDIKFRFKNVGEKPLFIISANPGCGCTVADYPKAALPPGQEGEITAIFDSQNKPDGIFYKNILVTTNTNPNVKYLYFKGSIGSGPDTLSQKKKEISAKQPVKQINQKDLILIPNKK